MRVVIVSRTIMPMIAPRSFRATELAKEFARQGHEVHVYAKLGSYNYNEFKSKYNVHLHDLGKTYFSRQNSDGYYKPTIFDRILRKLFKYILEFPDIELMFNVYNKIKNLKNIDAIISIAVPYPIHWGVALAKTKDTQNFPNVWIADCGDPYMGSKLYKHPFYFEYVEKWFFRKVDYITIPMQAAMDGYYPEFHGKIKIIPQGFNFNEIKLPNYLGNTIPTFMYAGLFNSNYRNLKPFLDYLCSIDINFKFILYTNITKELISYEKQLGSKLELNAIAPREEIIKIMKQCDFLINFENSSKLHLPSKLIDYLIVDRPILNIPFGEFEPSIFEQFLKGDYKNKYIIANPNQYNIEKIVNRMTHIIKHNSKY